MTIYSLNIDIDYNPRDEIFLYDYISQEREDRIDKFAFVEDKRVLLYSELLARNVIAFELNIPVEKVVLLQECLEAMHKWI